MAEEDRPVCRPPETFTIDHVESAQFRTVYAAGAVFSGPIDTAKNWVLTFYNEGARIVSESLVRAEAPGAYKLADPPRIETHLIRRDEVAIIISEGQLAALVNALAARLKGSAT